MQTMAQTSKYVITQSQLLYANHIWCPVLSSFCTPILQGVARGGVSVSVNLEYQIEGSGEGRLCPTGSPNARGCVGVSHGWRNNRINLDAWYQIRGIRWCSRRIWSSTIVSQSVKLIDIIPVYTVNIIYCDFHACITFETSLYYVQIYPCGITWGSRRQGAFSRTWNLPGRQLSSLYSTCGSMRDPTCWLSWAVNEDFVQCPLVKQTDIIYNCRLVWLYFALHNSYQLDGFVSGFCQYISFLQSQSDCNSQSYNECHISVILAEFSYI